MKQIRNFGIASLSVVALNSISVITVQNYAHAEEGDGYTIAGANAGSQQASGNQPFVNLDPTVGAAGGLIDPGFGGPTTPMVPGGNSGNNGVGTIPPPFNPSPGGPIISPGPSPSFPISGPSINVDASCSLINDDLDLGLSSAMTNIQSSLAQFAATKCPNVPSNVDAASSQAKLQAAFEQLKTTYVAAKSSNDPSALAAKQTEINTQVSAIAAELSNVINSIQHSPLLNDNCTSPDMKPGQRLIELNKLISYASPFLLSGTDPGSISQLALMSSTWLDSFIRGLNIDEIKSKYDMSNPSSRDLAKRATCEYSRWSRRINQMRQSGSDASGSSIEAIKGQLNLPLASDDKTSAVVNRRNHLASEILSLATEIASLQNIISGPRGLRAVWTAEYNKNQQNYCYSGTVVIAKLGQAGAEHYAPNKLIEALKKASAFYDKNKDIDQYDETGVLSTLQSDIQDLQTSLDLALQNVKNQCSATTPPWWGGGTSPAACQPATCNVAMQGLSDSLVKSISKTQEDFVEFFNRFDERYKKDSNLGTSYAYWYNSHQDIKSSLSQNYWTSLSKYLQADTLKTLGSTLSSYNQNKEQVRAILFGDFRAWPSGPSHYKFKSKVTSYLSTRSSWPFLVSFFASQASDSMVGEYLYHEASIFEKNRKQFDTSWELLRASLEDSIGKDNERAFAYLNSLTTDELWKKNNATPDTGAKGNVGPIKNFASFLKIHKPDEGLYTTLKVIIQNYLDLRDSLNSVGEMCNEVSEQTGDSRTSRTIVYFCGSPAASGYKSPSYYLENLKELKNSKATALMKELVGIMGQVESGSNSKMNPLLLNGDGMF